MTDTNEVHGTDAATEVPQGPTQNDGPRVVWHDSDMATSFANVVNIQSTQEQIDLFFGMNQTWNARNDGSVTVELNNRVIMSPHAAKRLWRTLGGVIKQHESRHGGLKID